MIDAYQSQCQARVDEALAAVFVAPLPQLSSICPHRPGQSARSACPLAG